MADYTVTISSTDEICFKTDSVIQEWINDAVAAKIHHNKEILIAKYVQHCTSNEVQMKVTSVDQINHARELGLAVFAEEMTYDVNNKG